MMGLGCMLQVLKSHELRPDLLCDVLGGRQCQHHRADSGRHELNAHEWAPLTKDFRICSEREKR